VGIPHVSIEQFMINKTKTFAHNTGKAKTSEKSNNNNNKDKDNNDNNNANINNTSYNNNNNDNNEDNNNNKNTKTKGKLTVVQESASSSSRITTTTTITIPTKVTNKDKNQINNKKDTLKDKAIEKNQKKTPNTKIPDPQSPTIEASDFSSMIRKRKKKKVRRK
jgi:hypothetical protein